MTGLIEAILIQIIIPEVGALMRRKPNITDAEIIAELAARRERMIENGRAFLAETDPTA